VLNLRLIVQGSLLLAETAEGARLLSPEQEAAARRATEAENELLRRELASLRDEHR